MKKDMLSRYFWLNHEIGKQEKRLKRIQKKAGDIATDIVKGSSSQYPYIETKFKITGAPSTYTDELEKTIDKNIEEAMALRCDIESFINNVDDPHMREILRSRFIDCLQWDKVGKENFISKDHARKMVREFLKNAS